MSLRTFFIIWRMKTENRHFFNEAVREFEAEEEFARVAGMDSIYWCHACKYGDCERHSND